MVKERIANIGIPLDVLPFCFLNFFLAFCFFGGSLQTSLLCIVGELAGEWSVAVAVGISDR